ncbi:hypothetical protein II906_04640 [bacterium]|nr:hypothetical protein [bacterium]
MIYCCGALHEPVQTVFLYPTLFYKKRKLELTICPNCGNIVAEIVQYNSRTKKWVKFRPKAKKVKKLIQDLQNDFWQAEETKSANKFNASFSFGLNRQYKNGKIYQFAVDFNGKKELVKIIDAKENYAEEEE